MSATDPRIPAILELVTKLAAGDLTARRELGEGLDALDAVIAGLNMLGEELTRQAEQRQRAEGLLEDAVDLYENAPAMFCSLEGPNHRIIKCNRTLAESLGAAEGTGRRPSLR